MDTAYSYLRFSSDQQADGDTERRQTEARDAWLRRHPSVQLDTSLKPDRGVSGYRGKHRRGKHGLAQFLDRVERGRVAPGSYLIVENLDRLTREEPEDSIPLVMNLIRVGVRVVQLLPTEVMYERGMDFGRMTMMLWELARGHGESKRRSSLLGEVWKEKKRKAGTDLLPYGRQCPAWLELVGVKRLAGDRQDFSKAKYRVKEDAAAAVRKVFHLCVSGLGLTAIVARLNEEGVPSIGKKSHWCRYYIHKLFTNPAVIGVYQPMTGSDKRVADGEPVPGYYPAVVDEGVYYAAQAAMGARKRKSGRPPSAAFNPFSGLLRNAVDGSKLYIVSSARRGAASGGCYKYLIPASVVHRQRGAGLRSFPLQPLVSALLSKLSELSSSELFKDPGGTRVGQLEGRLAEAKKRLNVATIKFEADPESAHWQGLVDKYDREKRALAKELEGARATAANPVSQAWEEAVALMAEKEPERLRQALLVTVEGVYCLFISDRPDRTAIVQVLFHGGAVRWYRIKHRQATANGVTNSAAVTTVESWTLPKLGQLDMRKPEDAELAEALNRRWPTIERLQSL